MTTKAEMLIDWDASAPTDTTKRRWGRPVFPSETPRPHEKAVCAHCGMEFWRKPRGRPPIYCSDLCRDHAREERFLASQAACGCFGIWRSTVRRARRAFIQSQEAAKRRDAER